MDADDISQSFYECTDISLDESQRADAIAKLINTQSEKGKFLKLLELLESYSDDDIVLCTVAKNLGTFSTFYSDKAIVKKALDVIRKMICHLVAVVRTQAAVAIVNVLKASNSFEEFYSPLINGLSKDDSYAARAGQSELCGKALIYISDKLKLESVKILLSNCFHEIDIVRIASIDALCVIPVPDTTIKDAIIKLGSNEKSGTVKLVLPQIAAKLIRVGAIKTIKGTFIELYCMDEDWRVRATIATIPEFLIEAKEKLLLDIDSRVRTCALRTLPNCYTLRGVVVDQRAAAELLQIIKKLSTDSQPNVQAALAQTLADFIVILGKELTVSNLLPLIKWMLESKDVNVCLNIISKIKQIVDVIGFDIFMDNIFGTVAEMFESNNWRIKLCAIETFPILATNIGTSFFSDQIFSLLMAWLCDGIYSVRIGTVRMIKEIACLFGMEWSKNFLFPQILQLHVAANFQHRMILLDLIKLLIPILHADIRANTFLPIVMKMAQDPIANVRNAVVNALEVFLEFEESNQTKKKIKLCLQKLSSDSDFVTKQTAKDILEQDIN